MFLTLEDGKVFEGRSVDGALECGGLLSFYTGVVGYQEVVTDPANIGKIVLFTYPLIGNYGVNHEDAESASPKVEGVIVREYTPYYSNFRAERSLGDYLQSAGIVFGGCFDTRAILLHLRENGEMMAVTSASRIQPGELSERIAALTPRGYNPENSPLDCESALVNARVVDLGASKSFYRRIAELGVRCCAESDPADVTLVTDCPYRAVEDDAVLKRVAGYVGQNPTIGFGNGAALIARACGVQTARMKFGHHGVNVPVRFLGGGRNEITIQNHNYGVSPTGEAEPLFENLHDGTCEGFACRSARAVGINFVPGPDWFRVALNAVGVN